MKFHFFATLAGCVASLSASIVPTPAMANILGNVVANSMIHAQLVQCKGGATTLPETAAREADGPAQVAIAKYWAAASAGDNAQMGAFFHGSGKAAWIADGVEVRVHSTPITDRYARTVGNLLVEKPVVLVRGRYGETARGVWEIRNSSGGHAGYYLVDFSRSSGWRPHRLELLPPNASVPAVNPYCQEPGDIDAFNEAAKAIPESQIAKITKKSTVVTTCVQGPDCAAKWSRARQWVQEIGVFPLIRDTDALLLTSGPVYADLTLAYVVVLDPPTPDGRRAMRFRAWCGNMFTCATTPANAREAFLAALQRNSAGGSLSAM